MLVKEFGDELFRCDFNKKWYLPAAGIPGFELDIYRGNYFLYFNPIVLTSKKPILNYFQNVHYFILGTARRIQYTLNNTDVGGYNPPPCFIDWPAPTDARGSATYKWTISHCPNLVRLFCHF